MYQQTLSPLDYATWGARLLSALFAIIGLVSIIVPAFLYKQREGRSKPLGAFLWNRLDDAKKPLIARFVGVILVAQVLLVVGTDVREYRYAFLPIPGDVIYEGASASKRQRFYALVKKEFEAVVAKETPGKYVATLDASGTLTAEVPGHSDMRTSMDLNLPGFVAIPARGVAEQIFQQFEAQIGGLDPVEEKKPEPVVLPPPTPQAPVSKGE